MKTRKILTVLLSVILILSMVSCGGKTETPASASSEVPTSSETPASNEAPASSEAAPAATEALVAEEGAVVKFSYWAGSPSDEQAWNLILEQFKTDHPEIELKAEAYPSQTYISKLDTMIAGNEWPDVMRYTYQKIGKFKEAEVMLDLSDMIPAESREDLLPGYLQALTYDGKLVGMPHHTDTMGVFYNKAMFEASGIRIPTGVNDGWTWEEMTEISKKLKADHKLDYAFGGIWENKNAYRYLPFVYMNGGSVLTEDGTSLAIDSPEFLEAIKLYETLRADNLASSTGFTQENQCNMSFAAKQLAFVFAGSWQCSFMQENMPDGWALTYMPQVDGKTTSDMGGNALFAYSETKYPKAAAIFIDYVTNKENMKKFCESGNFLPVRQSLVSEGLTYSAFPEEMKIFSEITTTLDPKLSADETSPRFQALNLIMSEEMDQLVVGGRSAEDTVAAMKERMQEALDE